MNNTNNSANNSSNNFNKLMDKNESSQNNNDNQANDSKQNHSLAKLSNIEKSYLKGLAHHLNPTVMIGKDGLTDTVIKEIARSLTAHQLIKVRVFGDDREARLEMVSSIEEQLHALCIQKIGKLLVLFRANKPYAKIEDCFPIQTSSNNNNRPKAPRLNKKQLANQS
jgi:RNA-binding protein